MSQTISNGLFGAIGVTAIAYCLAAIGLNIHFGYTGLLNFGQAGFALVGGYAVAMPVMAFVTPGPEVTRATPTSPVARA